ncbi:hypothetical protein SCLCIDRAFT_24389 [Scleroderma citrinum Foug A]|uniref:Uncharacterized protein n=1 Tax=Scleroderma citrinum Foug A TaxID=1036808 RepID=A0A0C3AE90_9AGAM|nr:hypothetical protein SCLCIDRAFT_24389 [Scleroderma citrinum Foug A]
MLQNLVYKKIREAREKMAASRHQGRVLGCITYEQMYLYMRTSSLDRTAPSCRRCRLDPCRRLFVNTASSVSAWAPTSRKSWKKIPETVTTTPTYRPTVSEPRIIPPSQTEARMTAQMEFQMWIKEAAASTIRQREFELAVALEDALRKAQRTETGEGSFTPRHLTDTPRIRLGTASPAHRTSYIATSPGAL